MMDIITQLVAVFAVRLLTAKDALGFLDSPHIEEITTCKL